MRYLVPIILALVFAFTGTAYAAESERIDTGKVYAQLVSSHDAILPGDEFYVALRTELDPGWHTYWRNPGDSGEPVQITWDVPDTLTYGEIVWPLPKPIATGPLINYGFEDVPHFPVKFTLSETANVGDQLTINADIYYLVCLDVCIPESGQLSLDVTVGEPIIDDRWNAVINRSLEIAPKKKNVQGSAILDGEDVVFRFSNTVLDAPLSSLYVFPYGQGLIDHSAPQKFVKGDGGYEVRIPAGFEWESGTPETLKAVFGYSKDGKMDGEIVALSTDTPLDIGLASSSVGGTSAGSNTGQIGLWGALFGALLGGLILNLMPCVFPVISLKALSIAKMAHGERRAIQKEAWLYTLGVLATFMALVLILVLLKESWGFQLQSPPVVGALAVILFLVALNLLGVFEVGGNIQGLGSSLTQKEGGLGSFLTGALAVIVATPCTAPFMASAIGFTVTQSALVTFAVFTALAIGFALPFLIISYVPGILKLLPKPGAWMERFKEFLAFPMFAAVIWLVWVLTLQAGETGLIRLLGVFLALGFALWLLKRKAWISRAVAALLVLGSVATVFMLHPKAVAYPGTDSWSTEKVAELRADGKAVFIDFTAAWCVTCQANKKAVLDTDPVRAAFARTNTAFLVADWTNKNDTIKAELERHGRAGVPLYLLYPPGHNDVSPEILPQILTKDMVISKLEDAGTN